ncbi:MAG TPA: chemotaxis protein CheA [Candidatus Binatia bacterium]|nr:chemotaxis protein CheA [Candidatus Binatia bacterium]
MTDIDRDFLMKVFQEESRDNLASLEEALVALEERPADVELLKLIFRMVHTLKGSAAMIGLQDLADFAHTLEDVLDDLRKGKIAAHSDLITLLLQMVDVLRATVQDAVAGRAASTPERLALMRRIEEVAGRAGQDAPAGAPVAAAGSPVAPAPDAAGRAAAPAPVEAGAGVDRRRTLRVGLDHLDRMLTLSGEIAIARLRVRQGLEGLGKGAEALLETDRLTDGLFLDLQELILRVRMVPIGPIFRQHLRTVRDVAGSLGKTARLVIEGGDVEVDARVVEHLKDVLVHLVRNALDHGIETPEARRRAGKDPCGQVVLRARHEGSSIDIEMEDDGAGLNRERIVARARALGVGPADPGALSDAELFRLIFQPGFSTAEIVSDISGRGVGLDVAVRNVEAMGGTIEASSTAGRGTVMRLRIPLTLSIIAGLSVGTAGDTYVIPLDSVVECLEMPAEERRRPGPAGLLNLRGSVLPYVRLRHLFGLGEARSGRENVVVLRQGTARAGLVVDALYGERQAVIKPLGRMFQNLPGVSGSTILGDGRVALILNAPALMREAAARQAAPPSAGAE